MMSAVSSVALVCRAPSARNERTGARFKHTTMQPRKARFSSMVVRGKEDKTPTPTPPLADADASIEPCLVGWSDVDENGVDVYCCEQPGGAVQCNTVSANPQHEECELETKPDGSLDISCDEDDGVTPIAR